MKRETEERELYPPVGLKLDVLLGRGSLIRKL
jgi:hypothetical protein